MIHIKCRQCGEFNTNDTLCLACNAPLKTEKLHQSTIEKQHKERVSKPFEPPKAMIVLKQWRQHPNFLLKSLGHLLYSIAFVIFAVVSSIAWLIATFAV